jgi:hypothetical protein
MGSERHYPEITAAMLWPFQLVIEHMKEDPTYLSGAQCPYSGEVKAFLSLLSQTPKDGSVADRAAALMDGDLDQQGGLEANIKRIFKELTAWGQALGNGDTAEKQAYFRVSTSLLEKLVMLEAQAKNTAHVKEFERIILAFLDDHVTPDARTKLMDQLKALA